MALDAWYETWLDLYPEPVERCVNCQQILAGRVEVHVPEEGVFFLPRCSGCHEHRMNLLASALIHDHVSHRDFYETNDGLFCGCDDSGAPLIPDVYWSYMKVEAGLPSVLAKRPRRPTLPVE